MSKGKILFVDDDPNVLAAYKRTLGKFFDVSTAEDGKEALGLIASEKAEFAVIVSDMRMPEMDGAEFLKAAAEISPKSVRMLLTGYAELEAAMKAVNEANIFRFLTKPCPVAVMKQTIEEGIEQHRLIKVEQELTEETLLGSVRLIVEMLSVVEPKLFSEALNLREAARLVAKKLGLEDIWMIELAALLSRIGYVTMPTELLKKAEANLALTADEEGALVCAPEIGHKLVSIIPRLGPAADIILYQHKGYDGSGVPEKGPKGEELPHGARILKILLDMYSFEYECGTMEDAIAHMAGFKERYDPKIWEIVSSQEFFEEIADLAPEWKLMEVAVNELMLGDVILQHVITTDGERLVPGGKEVTKGILVQINNYSKLKEVKEPIQIRRKRQISDVEFNKT